MKQAILCYGGMTLGVLACAGGVYLATSIHYHERAYGVFIAGIVCILAGFASKYAGRGWTAYRWLSPAIYFDVIVFGMLVSVAGATLILMLHYHTRAYAFLLFGMICLLIGLVRILVVPAIIKATYLLARH